MAKEVLGRLTKVDNIREVWSSEASDFTPWLAEEENLALLGETLGIQLELDTQEKAVGPFRADILCRDTGSGRVLIENQLERTDHGHLGQLLTYASGLDAATIIWIAARFNDEHRSTLDWLNKITEERFRFVGIEVELWRIGDSPVAPKFNVVSKPDDWSRFSAQGNYAVDLSPVRAMQLEYWTAFDDALRNACGRVPGGLKAQAQSWMSYGIGRPGLSLAACMSRPKRHVRAEVYMSGRKAKAFFNRLHEQRDGVERQLGYGLEWEELPAGLDSRIAIYLRDVNPEDRADWPRQHEWLATKLDELHGAFAERVRRLDLNG